MEEISNEIISKINTEIEISCIDNDLSSDKALHMINFIRPLFEELREFIHKYNFQDSEEEIDFFKNVKPVYFTPKVALRQIWCKMAILRLS